MKIPTITKDQHDEMIRNTSVIFEIKNKLCPQCGSQLIKTRACTGLVKEGWETMLRCPKVTCRYLEGLEKKGGNQNED